MADGFALRSNRRSGGGPGRDPVALRSLVRRRPRGLSLRRKGQGASGRPADVVHVRVSRWARALRGQIAPRSPRGVAAPRGPLRPPPPPARAGAHPAYRAEGGARRVAPDRRGLAAERARRRGRRPGSDRLHIGRVRSGRGAVISLSYSTYAMFRRKRTGWRWRGQGVNGKSHDRGAKGRDETRTQA